MPLLLNHSSLLAHTIYEALTFDSAMMEEGFDTQGTSLPDDVKKWEGINEVILGNPEWFEKWLTAEKSCQSLLCFDLIDFLTYLFPAVVESQYNDIINASDAWLASDEANGDDHPRGLKPTVSSRRIKSLVEQITGQYFPFSFSALIAISLT